MLAFRLTVLGTGGCYGLVDHLGMSLCRNHRLRNQNRITDGAMLAFRLTVLGTGGCYSGINHIDVSLCRKYLGVGIPADLTPVGLSTVGGTGRLSPLLCHILVITVCSCIAEGQRAVCIFCQGKGYVGICWYIKLVSIASQLGGIMEDYRGGFLAPPAVCHIPNPVAICLDKHIAFLRENGGKLTIYKGIASHIAAVCFNTMIRTVDTADQIVGRLLIICILRSTDTTGIPNIAVCYGRNGLCIAVAALGALVQLTAFLIAGRRGQGCTVIMPGSLGLTILIGIRAARAGMGGVALSCTGRGSHHSIVLMSQRCNGALSR